MARRTGTRTEGRVLAHELGDFVHGLTASVLPPSTVDAAKRCVLDLIGAAVAGSEVKAARAFREVAMESSAGGPAGVWFSGAARDPVGAALANSAAASALDIDDGHRGSGGHPGAAVIPAAVAEAEALGAEGLDLLVAIVVGYEIGVRMAAARDLERLDTLATGRWGACAAAAASGWLRRTPPDQLAEALAIAGVHAPGLVAFGYTARKGNGVKEAIPWSTLTGLSAIRLAERGLSGPVDLFDHPDHFSAERLLDGLGARYAVEDVYFKPYGCCRWVHPAVDALQAIVTDQQVTAEDVIKIDVWTFSRTLRLGNRADPLNLESAQFSIPYCLAITLLFGPEALQPLSPALLGRRELVEIAQRVELHLDAAYDAAFPEQTPARVRVETRSGAHEVQIEYPLGDPANPMDAERLEGKFRRLTAGYWDPTRQAEVLDTVAGLDRPGQFERLAVALEARQ